jgi:hypothetical protein
VGDEGGDWLCIVGAGICVADIVDGGGGGLFLVFVQTNPLAPAVGCLLIAVVVVELTQFGSSSKAHGVSVDDVGFVGEDSDLQARGVGRPLLCLVLECCCGL